MSVPTEQEATQRPAYASMAEALEATDPEFMDSAPATEEIAPAAAAPGEPVAPAEATTQETPETPAEIDYKAEYEKLQQQLTSEAGRELSAAGRLKKANEENARLKAERDDFERQVQNQNERIDKWWQDAIDAAPEQEKAEYRRLHAIDQKERLLAQKEQQQQLVDQQAQQRQAGLRQQAESTARSLAISELDYAIGARAQHEGLPPELFKPVRDFIGSPQMQKLAETLPLRGTTPPGDPKTWDFRAIDNLDTFRTYLVAQAQQGYDYYTRQHQQARAQAEEAQVAQNAKEAQQVYQPERAVGAGLSPQRADLSKYRNSNNIAAVLDIEDGLTPG